ncbi:SigE family RNA polymerase sigma factor [Microtetraspora sp. NBRC 16547]|uniref:SigE family RNA polymerase sigma factor n=1 Tax=Microtetraspora sp. NBRC 16547 TaxID=3030993 RepID=UPI0024A418B7|nr:SigE family RNA polymerase sigma factor [Microtetraspora sp. NBRC 16547]GLX00693.1 RNA polymerase subunit sigma-24 [Microtetraspora sp. NBRC 16547]
MQTEIRNVMEDPPPELHAVAPPADATVAELFMAHRLGLVRFAFLLVGDQETAEDVVQDAFAAVHRRWRRLADHGQLLPYLRTAVLNGCRTVHRRRAIARRFRGDPEVPFWSAEASALLGEARREVFTAVRDLPRRQREAVVLRYYLDLSEAEMAVVMGVSRGTVKSTTSRALRALAAKLEEGR